MRNMLKLALMLFPLWTAAIAPAAAAQAYDDSGDRVMVSAEQGQALAEFALQSGPRVRPKPDCSHLVHLLYERAGLVYPYEGSRVLYRGVADFERVKTPQSGDLVVWLGHVGIVLSPEETTFLSSVRSGIITESWKAEHWVRRGRPHFFRYRIGPAADLTLLAAIMDDDRSAHDPSNARSSAAAQTSLPAGEQSATKKRDSDVAATQGSRDARSEPGEPANAGADANSMLAVMEQRGTPNKHEIAAALIEGANARARRLISGQMLDLGHPLCVFDRLEIAKIKVKRGSGSLTVRVSETTSQESGKILPARTTERELLMDRRSDGAWAISDPSRRTYLPQAQAVSVFERQAAIFLERAPNSSATRTVVKVLDRLYDQQPGAPQRAAVK